LGANPSSARAPWEGWLTAGFAAAVTVLVVGLSLQKLLSQRCYCRRIVVSVAVTEEASACNLGERLLPRVRIAHRLEL